MTGNYTAAGAAILRRWAAMEALLIANSPTVTKARYQAATVGLEWWNGIPGANSQPSRMEIAREVAPHRAASFEKILNQLTADRPKIPNSEDLKLIEGKLGVPVGWLVGEPHTRQPEATDWGCPWWLAAEAELEHLINHGNCAPGWVAHFEAAGWDRLHRRKTQGRPVSVTLHPNQWYSLLNEIYRLKAHGIEITTAAETGTRAILDALSQDLHRPTETRRSRSRKGNTHDS